MSRIPPLVMFNILKAFPKKYKQDAIDLLMQQKTKIEILVGLPNVGTLDVYTFEFGHSKLTMIDYRWKDKIELSIRHNKSTKTLWLS